MEEIGLVFWAGCDFARLKAFLTEDKNTQPLRSYRSYKQAVGSKIILYYVAITEF